MTSRPAALALSTLVLLAGCTTQPTTASSPTGSPPPTISPAPMSPGSAGSNTPAPPGSTGPAIPAPSGSAGSNTCRQVRPAVTVSDADDGATVCLIVGGELTVSLPGPGWQSPVAQGDLLVPDSTPGAVTVTRFRVSRPGPTRSSPPGASARRARPPAPATPCGRTRYTSSASPADGVTPGAGRSTDRGGDDLAAAGRGDHN